MTPLTNQEHTPARKRILLVDGNRQVREALHRVLSIENYDVAPAATSREALRWFDGGTIDMVVLDMNLPNESGWDVYRQLYAVQPNLPVIATTELQTATQRTLTKSGVELMEKPLNLSALLQTMRKLAAEEQKEPSQT